MWAKLLPVQCSRVTELDDELIDGGLGQNDRMLKQVTRQAYVWSIWKGRNDVIFKNKEFNSLRTANDIQAVVFLWYSLRGDRSRMFDWNQWCCNPLSVIL